MESDEKVIRTLVSQLEGPEPHARNQALAELIRFGHRAVPVLREKIFDKWGAVTEPIIKMGYPENRDAIPDLVKCLMYAGDNPHIDGIILRSLRALGHPVIEPIRKVLAEHPDDDWWVFHAARVLLGLELSLIEPISNDLIHALEVGLNHDHSSYCDVIELLGRIASPKADRAIPTIAQYYVRNQEGSLAPAEIVSNPATIEVRREIRPSPWRAHGQAHRLDASSHARSR